MAATDKLKIVAERKGLTMAELAVAWVLRIPEVSVALVGAKDSEQVRMNSTAGSYAELTPDEIVEIGEILDNAPETGVGHLRALPNPVDGLTGAEEA